MPAATESAKRLGRPPRVTAKQIAEAALAIGLEHATIRNVAARLDMSVPGLRHHVRTREDLVAMYGALASRRCQFYRRHRPAVDRVARAVRPLRVRRARRPARGHRPDHGGHGQHVAHGAAPRALLRGACGAGFTVAVEHASPTRADEAITGAAAARSAVATATAAGQSRCRSRSSKRPWCRRRPPRRRARRDPAARSPTRSPPCPSPSPASPLRQMRSTRSRPAPGRPSARPRGLSGGSRGRRRWPTRSEPPRRARSRRAVTG